jgi:hypothetical protein
MHELSLRRRMAGYEPAAWALIPDLGLYMDQVITYIEQQLEPLYGEAAQSLLTPSMINNYVKTGLLDRPQGKKYYRSHLALLMMIVTLKPVASMDDIARLTARKESQTVEQLYGQFRRMQEQVFRSISIDPEAGPLLYAVTATAYHLVTESCLQNASES